MARKKKFNTKYSPEFKLSVILDMRENGLSCRETVRKYWDAKTGTEEDRHRSQVRLWKRIYLEEGAEGLAVERRGRSTKMDNPNKGRARKKPLPPEDLIDELQKLRERNEYLEMENEYLKKLDALIRAEEQKKKQ